MVGLLLMSRSINNTENNKQAARDHCLLFNVTDNAFSLKSKKTGILEFLNNDWGGGDFNLATLFPKLHQLFWFSGGKYSRF